MYNAIIFMILLTSMLNWILVYNQLQLLKEINKSVKRLWLKKPGIVTFKSYEGENGMLKFVLCLPEKSAADVVLRKLTVSVGGQEAQLLELAADVLETAEFECFDGAEVVGKLIDVDDAGNESPAREFSFKVMDTLAPPMPGELGVKVTAEFEVEPEPEVQPEPEADAQEDDMN